MLNPVSISCNARSRNINDALGELDGVVSAAVTVAQQINNVLLNQISIIPLGVTFGTDSLYTATSTVLYPVTN